MAEDVSEEMAEKGFFSSYIDEIIYSPLNMIMIAIVLYLLYKIMKTNNEVKVQMPAPPPPKLKKQDMTREQLMQYNGKGEYVNICIGVNGKVFDVTRGKRFYGPGGPYCAFAGHDATRCFATFSVEDIKDEDDDISDLNSTQMDSVREWEMQFYEKYDYVGRLLKPGDVPNEYSDEEDAKDPVDKKKE